MAKTICDLSGREGTRPAPTRPVGGGGAGKVWRGRELRWSGSRPDFWSRKVKRTLPVAIENAVTAVAGATWNSFGSLMGHRSLRQRSRARLDGFGLDSARLPCSSEFEGASGPKTLMTPLCPQEFSRLKRNRFGTGSNESQSLHWQADLLTSSARAQDASVRRYSDTLTDVFDELQSGDVLAVKVLGCHPLLRDIGYRSGHTRHIFQLN